MKRVITIGVLLAAAANAGMAGEPAPKDDQAARIARLCKELGETEFGSQGACEQLIQIGAPAVPVLIGALKDPRPQARWWAVAALCNIAPEEGYAPVLKAIESDPNPLVRSTAVYYLRHYLKKAKKDVWPEVEKALADKDPEVGRWALRLMVEENYPDADRKLREILAGGSSALRSYALDHIRDMGDKGKAYLPLVRQLLSSEDPRLRYDVVAALVSLMDAGQLDFLRDTFRRDKDPAVKECCLRCITSIPTPPVECFDLYIEGMQSDNEKVREIAHRLVVKGFKQYFGFDPKGPLPMREIAIKKWQDWFAQNRAKLEWHPDLRKFLPQGTREKGPEKGKSAPPDAKESLLRRAWFAEHGLCPLAEDWLKPGLRTRSLLVWSPAFRQSWLSATGTEE
ncbi:MAG: HEAT repeat domain-containing protein [Planctomycetes bacterium]|nr:HEAT repeat domain-containing protein [Planctomycetota bacterium]